MSELTDAIRSGDAERALALVDADLTILDETENGVTPVLLAVYHGKRELARLLASRRPPSFGEACALGDAERVEALLAADPALLHSRTADGFPSFALAVFFGHPALARRLIEAGADVNAVAENPMRVSPAHAAVAAGDRESLRLLLERGADANARQMMDYTPLHEAANKGDIAMAALLLEHGADPDARSTDGMRPADLARKSERAEFLAWLETTGR